MLGMTYLILNTNLVLKYNAVKTNIKYYLGEASAFQ